MSQVTPESPPPSPDPQRSVAVRTPAAPHPGAGLMALACIAFVALGLPDGLLGVGWPSIRADFSLPLDAIGGFLTAVVCGYMTSSFLCGVLLSRMGVGRMLAASCLLTGVALIGYTLVPHWWMMVLLGAAAGLGAGAIDAGLNTYAATHFSEGFMQWLHASWGAGTTLGPLIMTLGLTSLHTWRFGYQVVGGFQLALAAGFMLTVAMWNRNSLPDGPAAASKPTAYQTPLGETLRQSRVWLSVLLFFTYVGAEAALGTWTYTLLTESRGVEEALAGFFAGSYWLAFTVGRFAAGWVANRVGGTRLVQGGLAGALAGALLLIWNPGRAANLGAVVLIGLAIAPIFPAMMSGTRARVGDRYMAHTIGMQMAATGFGAAIIPAAMGMLARRFSLEILPYLVLAVYGGLAALYALAVRAEKAHPAARR